MTNPPFTGVGVALVTLFDDGGEVDLDATATLAADLVGAGVTAVVLAGSTGEAAALDAAERVALVDVVRAAVPAGVPIIVGTGAPSARQAARLTAEVVSGAADGAVPVMAYHFPLMSGPGIDVDVLPRLTDVAVVGLKDSSGDASRLVRT